MNTKNISVFAVCAALFCSTTTASASVQFSLNDLENMVVAASVDWAITPVPAGQDGLIHAGPNYEDGQTGMSGIAGATATLAPNGYVGYTLTGAELAAFNALISGGSETLSMIAFNDNDDEWQIGIWYSEDGTAATTFSDSQVLAAGGSAALSLALPTGPLTYAGVFIIHPGTHSVDAYHASWGIPEPTMLVVWSVLGMMGVSVIGRRSRVA